MNIQIFSPQVLRHQEGGALVQGAASSISISTWTPRACPPGNTAASGPPWATTPGGPGQSRLSGAGHRLSHCPRRRRRSCWRIPGCSGGAHRPQRRTDHRGLLPRRVENLGITPLAAASAGAGAPRHRAGCGARGQTGRGPPPLPRCGRAAPARRQTPRPARSGCRPSACNDHNARDWAGEDAAPPNCGWDDQHGRKTCPGNKASRPTGCGSRNHAAADPRSAPCSATSTKRRMGSTYQRTEPMRATLGDSL